MQDRQPVEGVLLTVKGLCGLYMNATVESETKEVRAAFEKLLNDMLDMQDEIFTRMTEKGWYQTTEEKQQKIQKTRQKFAPKS